MVPDGSWDPWSSSTETPSQYLGVTLKRIFPVIICVYWMEDCTYQEIISTQKSLNIQFWRKKKYRVKPVIDRNLSFIPIIQQFSIHFSVLTDSRHTTCSTNIQLHCSGKSTNIYDNLHETKWRTCESYYWRIVHAG